jgi:hypothetical protein
MPVVGTLIFVSETIEELKSTELLTIDFPPNPKWAEQIHGEIPDGGVHCVGTWSALPCDLHQMAESSSKWLANILHCRPAGGGFVKLTDGMLVLEESLDPFKIASPSLPGERASPAKSILTEWMANHPVHD